MIDLKGDSGILHHMLDFESLSSGKPVPAVDVSDMKRVWELTSAAPRPEGAAPGSIGWDIRLIAGQCSQGADPLAVFFRVALLRPLVESGWSTSGATVSAPMMLCSSY